MPDIRGVRQYGVSQCSLWPASGSTGLHIPVPWPAEMSAQTFSWLPTAKSLPLHLHLPCLSWHRYKQEQAVVQDELYQVVMREREAATKYHSAFLHRVEGSVDQENQKSALLVSAVLPELAFHAFTMQGSRSWA